VSSSAGVSEHYQRLLHLTLALQADARALQLEPLRNFEKNESVKIDDWLKKCGEFKM
jgi:hypothetical protein